MKIRTKIILTVAILVVFSSLIAGVMYFISSKQLVEKNINAHLESVATLKGNQFSDFLRGRKEYIEEIEGEDEFLKAFFGIATNKQDIEEMRALMKNRLLPQNGFFEFFVIDLNGKILVSTDIKQEGKFRSEETYFINGKKETYFHNFYHDIAINSPASTVATPIKDINEKVIGVLAGRLNLDTISKLMAEHSGLGETGETYLVNKFNTVITEIRAEKNENFSRMIYTAGVKDCLNGNNGIHSVNYENASVIGVHKWNQEKEICLIAEIRESEAYASLNYLRLIFLLVGTLLALFTMIIGNLLARSLSKPILKLRENAKQITEGDLETKISITTKDEIGELAYDFEKMTTQLRTYTKNLQEEKAKLVASIDSLSMGFVLFNPKNEIILKNAAIEHIFNNLRKNELSFDWLEAELKMKISVEDCLREKTLCEFKEVDWQNKILRVIIVPVLIDSKKGEIIGFVLLFEDVTEERLLDRTKNEFFAIASHELRTPLTAIKGNAEMLKTIFSKEINNKEVLEMISDIQEESVRLIGITNDFLDVSRTEQHRNKFVLVPIDLNSVAKNIVNELKNIGKAKENMIIFKENKIIRNVVGDKDRVHQIFTNLIANANNYTEKGMIIISLANEDDHVKISIADTGSGIPEENRKFLFRKFQQAGTNIFTRNTEKGTGLGLYISRLLIEDMNGKIWLEKSEIGVGSTFSFTLPSVVS